MNGYQSVMLRRLSRFSVILVLAILAIGGVRTTRENHSQNIALMPLASIPARVFLTYIEA